MSPLAYGAFCQLVDELVAAGKLDPVRGAELKETTPLRLDEGALDLAGDGP